MNTEPKPANEGEWTVERLLKYYPRYYTGAGLDELAKDINAAIATEREKTEHWCDMHTVAAKEIQQLRAQQQPLVDALRQIEFYAATGCLQDSFDEIKRIALSALPKVKDGKMSDQPKPATDEHQASILSENAKTVRTLQEWTPALLSRLFDAECSPEEAIKRICSLHNAALAADREIAFAAQQAALREGIRSGELDKQLADEREKLSSVLADLTVERERHQKQLAAAQAAIALIRSRCKNTQPTRHAFNDILEWCKVGTSALAEAGK